MRFFIGCAWQQSAGQLDPQSGSVKLHENGAQFFMSGEICFVEPGAGVDGWLVFADAAGEGMLAWVPRDASGVSLRCERRVDGALWAAMRLDQVRIHQQNFLARGDAASAALANGIDGARLIQAAELLGLGRRALSMTLDYVKTRTQFGKPIGSFQALQHRLVDAKIQVELAAASLAEALRDSSDRRASRNSRAAQSRGRLRRRLASPDWPSNCTVRLATRMLATLASTSNALLP